MYGIYITFSHDFKPYLNPDLKWNANERFQFLKIGFVFMKMDLGGL